MKKLNFISIFTAFLTLSASSVLAAGSGVTYQGRLLDPSGHPVVGTNVQFRIQLRTPGNENCLLYEELQSKNLSQTEGVFAITINDGTGVRTDTSGYGLDQIFANRGSFSFAGGQCATGTSYSPNATDGRRIQVYFNDGVIPVGQWEAMPSMAINFVPMSIESQQVGGYKKEQLLRIASTVSTTNTELGLTAWTDLQALIAGTSNKYVKPTDQVTQIYGAPVPAPANGQSIRWNSALNAGAGGWENFTAGTASGAVTSIATGTGLLGGPITTSGTISVDVGTTTGKIVQVAAGNKLPVIDGSNLTNLSAAGISTGTLPVTRGGTGATTFGNNGVVLTNGTGSAFQSLNCTIGQVLSFDVSGYAICGGAPSSLPATAGTVSAPSYAFVGDTDTGMYSPAANQIGLSVSGVEAVRIKDNGYVGIGETNPNAKLHIVGDGNSILMQPSTATNGVAAYMLNTGNGSVFGVESAGGGWHIVGSAPYATIIGNQSAQPLQIGTNNAVRMTVDAAGSVGIGISAPAEKLEVNGAVKIGTTANACTAANKGSIRYNDGTSVLEFCNGTNWNLVQAAACTDATPSAFSFSDEANATASTLYTSNIIQVTGINCSVPVTISGTGSPQFQICADAACTSVVQGWTSSPSSITNNQYIQARLTTDSVGGSTFQGTIIVGSGATVWSVTNAGGDCTASPAVGTVCADGTIYAGLSPDGNVKMFTTRCDAGQTWNGVSCTGIRTGLSWNNGTSTFPSTGIQGLATGKSNSAALAVLADAASPYAAAQNCETLNENGHTDWYLPAINELGVLYSGRAAIRNFDLGSTYWSSTEANWDQAKALYVSFWDGSTNAYYAKHNGMGVRCVRR